MSGPMSSDLLQRAGVKLWTTSALTLVSYCSAFVSHQSSISPLITDMLPLDSGRYYSFPSFDTWDPDQQEKEGDDIKVA